METRKNTGNGLIFINTKVFDIPLPQFLTSVEERGRSARLTITVYAYTVAK